MFLALAAVMVSLVHTYSQTHQTVYVKYVVFLYVNYISSIYQVPEIAVGVDSN